MNSTGAHPTNGISIELKIRPKFAVLWFKKYATDHNEILHMSHSVTVIMCAKFICDQLNKFWTAALQFFLWNSEFDQNTISGTGARSALKEHLEALTK